MNIRKKVAFHTLGCKLNFSETSTLARNVEEAGFDVVPYQKPADVYVINTCSVTDHADKKCKNFINRALKLNANAYVVITGCYAQLKPKEIALIKGVDLVLGAAEKFNLVNHLTDLTKNAEGTYHCSNIDELEDFRSSYSFGNRTRSFLKVQDGCDYTCTFCTIPLARGKSRSDSIDSVVKKANEIAELGVKEIVLTGVNIGDFGKQQVGQKKQEETFYQLIEQLDNVDGIERIRISSIEPNLLSNEVIKLVAKSKKFVPHFHIPLQSGSNEILKKMRRRYLRELYIDRVEYIKRLMPNCCIGVDVIVGFPGETEAHFLETYEFLNELNISYLHVFTYSERPNTVAINLEDAVSKNIRKERNKMLTILSEKKRRAFYESQLGTVQNVLWENAPINDQLTGFTENYVKVVAPYLPEKANTIEEIELLDLNNNGLATTASKEVVLS